MSAIASDVRVLKAANDNYYLTRDKANDKRRIANVKAKNAANARVFDVGGEYMTVRQISGVLGVSIEYVSKEIRKMRTHGVRRFTLSHFTAANDEG